MRGRLAGIAMAVVSLVLAHDLTFLARYGSAYGEALVHAGHGEAWTRAVVGVLLGGAILAVVAVTRLHRLSLRAAALRHIGTPDDPSASLGAVPRRSLRTWLLLAPATGVVLTIQENLERLGATGSAPGPGILFSPEYAGGWLVVLIVTAIVALIAGLYVSRVEALCARLRATQRPPRAPRSFLVRAGFVLPRPASLIGRGGALRAPPRATAV